MFDKDLAQLYGVLTKNLNKSVNRNIERFPEDFMFRLTKEEYGVLRFQIGTSKRGGQRYLPYVFTEQGVAMLSSVLNSERAILVNIQIMRVFTKLREMMISHKDLAQKIEELEKKFKGRFGKQDKRLKDHEKIFDLIWKELLEKPIEEPPKTKMPVGFHP